MLCTMYFNFSIFVLISPFFLACFSHDLLKQSIKINFSPCHLDQNKISFSTKIGCRVHLRWIAGLLLLTHFLYLPTYCSTSPQLTWRDLQHIIARSSRFTGLKPPDLVRNGADLSGMPFFKFKNLKLLFSILSREVLYIYDKSNIAFSRERGREGVQKFVTIRLKIIVMIILYFNILIGGICCRYYINIILLIIFIIIAIYSFSNC